MTERQQENFKENTVRKKYFILISIIPAVASVLSLAGFYKSLGVLAAPAMFAPPIFIFVLWYLLSDQFRMFANSFTLKELTQYNLIRFVGFLILLAVALKKIPSSWGVPAGIGDILTGVLALVCLKYANLRSRYAGESQDATGPRRSTTLWFRGAHLVGLIDIFMLASSAVIHTLQGYEQMYFMTQFPMALLPAFYVPVALITHLLAFKILFFKKKPRS